MSEARREAADRRLEEALEREGAGDPRGPCREMLRGLREEDEEVYREAIRHYEEALVPAITDEDADPLEAWEEFAGQLAAWTAPGRTVRLDRTGRSRAADEPPDRGDLVLHLPEEGRRRGIVVGRPPDPSAAQEAAVRLLVEARQTMAET